MTSSSFQYQEKKKTTRYFAYRFVRFCVNVVFDDSGNLKYQVQLNSWLLCQLHAFRNIAVCVCLVVEQAKMEIKIYKSLQICTEFLISNFRHVLNVVCFLLGYSPASEFCVLTFRNTLSVPSS